MELISRDLIRSASPFPRAIMLAKVCIASASVFSSNFLQVLVNFSASHEVECVGGSLRCGIYHERPITQPLSPEDPASASLDAASAFSTPYPEHFRLFRGNCTGILCPKTFCKIHEGFFLRQSHHDENHSYFSSIPSHFSYMLMQLMFQSLVPFTRVKCVQFY